MAVSGAPPPRAGGGALVAPRRSAKREEAQQTRRRKEARAAHLATPLAQEGGELLLLLPRQRVHAARGVRHGRRGRHAAPVGGAQAPRLMARVFPVRVLGFQHPSQSSGFGSGTDGLLQTAGDGFSSPQLSLTRRSHSPKLWHCQRNQNVKPKHTICAPLPLAAWRCSARRRRSRGGWRRPDSLRSGHRVAASAASARRGAACGAAARAARRRAGAGAGAHVHRAGGQRQGAPHTLVTRGAAARGRRGACTGESLASRVRRVSPGALARLSRRAPDARSRPTRGCGTEDAPRASCAPRRGRVWRVAAAAGARLSHGSS